jgi:hypothetical protein
LARTRKKKPPRRRPERYNALGLFLVVGAIISVVGLSAVTGAVVNRKMAADAASVSEKIATSLKTGEILFVNPNGHPCRQKVIDNSTWLMSEIGSVNCDQAVSQMTTNQRQQWSADRVEQIRSGLSGR